MNRDIALRDDRGWQIGPHLGAPAAAAPQPQAATIDFARFLRILHEWRWLILAATALGLILAVLATLLTTPLYRARVSLEVNPPRVEIMADQSKDVVSDANPWDFVATQVGLLKSTSVAQRVVEDLNLANNAAFADQQADPAVRLRQATQQVSASLSVTPPTEGNLVTFSYVSESPQLAAQIANAYANAFINSAFSAGMNRRLTRAISLSARSPRPVATSNGPSGSSSLMRSRKASSTRAAPVKASAAPTPDRSRASRSSL